MSVHMISFAQATLLIRHSRRLARLVSAWVAGLLFALVLVAQPARAATNTSDVSLDLSDAEKHIQSLIAQLGDPSYIKRQAAKAELETIGLVAFEYLRNAESHPNVEIASSATYLLESMRVVWTLPTDSFEVQRLLKEYNEYQTSQKLDCLQRLAQLQRLDGYLALLRLMRYENDEDISKTAALYLMDAAITKPRSKQLPPENVIRWPELIKSGVGDSQRTSAQWLQALAAAIDEPEDSLERWQDLVVNERKLLESNAKTTSEPTVRRLYRIVTKWLILQDRRNEAVTFFEPSLDLLGADQTSVLNDVQWMLEENLPEAVLKLDAQRPELFATRPRNRYLLAESYRKHGQLERAQAVAEEARGLVRAPVQLNRDGKLDTEAHQRLGLASFLNTRGLYDWAEAELLRAEAMHAEKGNLSTETELDVRDELGLFYWVADQPIQASEVWLPILTRGGLLSSKKNEALVDKELQSVLNERRTLDGKSYRTYIPARYHFYRGLAALKERDLPTARRELREAVQFDGADPDFLIAMTKAAENDTAFITETVQAIEKLEMVYRGDILREESELADARTRQMRQDGERRIATACNQLAWLLAGTMRKPREAIALSERSLLLREDEATYIDTLARCHFSAGNLDRAIELQVRAVSMQPHERQMQRQLAEFEAAKAAIDQR